MKTNEELEKELKADLAKATAAVKRTEKAYHDAQISMNRTADLLATHTHKVVLGKSTLMSRGKLFRIEEFRPYPGGIFVVASKQYTRTGRFGKALYRLGRVSETDWTSEAMTGDER